MARYVLTLKTSIREFDRLCFAFSISDSTVLQTIETDAQMLDKMLSVSSSKLNFVKPQSEVSTETELTIIPYAGATKYKFSNDSKSTPTRLLLYQSDSIHIRELYGKR